MRTGYISPKFFFDRRTDVRQRACFVAHLERNESFTEATLSRGSQTERFLDHFLDSVVNLSRCYILQVLELSFSDEVFGLVRMAAIWTKRVDLTRCNAGARLYLKVRRRAVS